MIAFENLNDEVEAGIAFELAQLLIEEQGVSA